LCGLKIIQQSPGGRMSGLAAAAMRNDERKKIKNFSAVAHAGFAIAGL
jgi:hypothetical protein